MAAGRFLCVLHHMSTFHGAPEAFPDYEPKTFKIEKHDSCCCSCSRLPNVFILSRSSFCFSREQTKYCFDLFYNGVHVPIGHRIVSLFEKIADDLEVAVGGSCWLQGIFQ